MDDSDIRTLLAQLSIEQLKRVEGFIIELNAPVESGTQKD